VYSEEAMEAAVKLSHKYIADRFLPDKVGTKLALVSLRQQHRLCTAAGGPYCIWYS
jgi:hypothetical protein